MLDFNESLENYILSHIDSEPDELKQLYRHTHIHHLYPRMCAGHYQGRLLKMLTTMINPARVLEIGTFTGYSTLSIAEGLDPRAIIDTIEVDDEKEDELRQLFGSSPYSGRINLYIGDALSVADTLPGPWQMVLIDANKRQYGAYLEAVLPKVSVGGYILADNTLWDMKVVDGDCRKDEQAQALSRFNDAVAKDSRLEKIILPVRDGLTVMRRVK